MYAANNGRRGARSNSERTRNGRAGNRVKCFIIRQASQPNVRIAELTITTKVKPVDVLRETGYKGLNLTRNRRRKRTRRDKGCFLPKGKANYVSGQQVEGKVGQGKE